MKPLVAITHWVHPEVSGFLAEEFRVTTNDTRDSWPHQMLLENARDAGALMVFMPDRVDAALLEACPNLKVIGAALKGFDNIDVETCTKRNIRVTYVPDLLTVPAAELTVGMMIALGRNVIAGHERVSSGAFSGWCPILYGTGISGETVGILGMGAIGQSIARRLSGFGARILGFDAIGLPSARAAELNVTLGTIDTILEQSTYVIAGLPLKPDTRHLFNDAAIQRMKPGSFLINIGRGSVVDEMAVSRALNSGHLGGYAADVFEFEDLSLPDRPRSIPRELLHSPQTLLLPHLGSAVEKVRFEISMSAARSIMAVLSGQRPETCLN